MRIGHGYDVHKLVENRDLIIGGVKIPHTMGLLGHSDADVLLHAISDALLGACALGDIGKHFPDTDPKYKGADSLMLLKEVVKLLVKGKTYHEIESDTGASTATISRINRSLNYGADGYKIVLEKLGILNKDKD